MRNLSFRVRSLGSEKPVVSEIGVLDDWIQQHVGIAADLITWEMETTLRAQVSDVRYPAAGGMWYGNRILAAFPNVSEKRIFCEFDLHMDDIFADCMAAGKIQKGVWWSVPSPQELNLIDDYFEDEAIAFEEVVNAMTRLFRFMRDMGAVGHILLYNDVPDPIDQEQFFGKHFLRYVPDAFLEELLEIQRDLILSADAVSRIPELLDCYSIRHVYVTDPTVEALIEVCHLVDPEDVFCAGIAPRMIQEAYWRHLSNLRVCVLDV
ncbi:MAG TPA: hypothetical protein O0Y05_03840 [Methanocorpusculum sp.]|nr:hypothetical protein [Methanocorpusculum sp.]